MKNILIILLDLKKEIQLIVTIKPKSALAIIQVSTKDKSIYKHHMEIIKKYANKV